jgi:hypothetical protein
VASTSAAATNKYKMMHNKWHKDGQRLSSKLKTENKLCDKFEINADAPQGNSEQIHEFNKIREIMNNDIREIIKKNETKSNASILLG